MGPPPASRTSNGMFTLHVRNASVAAGPEIRNVLGELVHARVLPLAPGSWEVDLAGLAAGVYIATVSDKGRVYQERMVKQ